jgi:Alpha/beta hydrolase domain
MTGFDELLGTLAVKGPLPVTGDSVPLGTAWLPGHGDEHGRGFDLSAHGYVEEEYLVSGQADDWTWDDSLRPVTAGPLPFTTRILLRRPADPAAFSGAVYLEPNHADYDRSLTWSATAPWLVRSGHAHVGVTQEIAALPDLARWDPSRYAALSIPRPGQRWDIVGLVAALVKSDAGVFAGYPVSRVIMSGWSQTGTFCRTFLGEGHHARSRAGDGPAVDGYVICISSGGAGRPGYGVLRPPAELALGDPRRTVGGHGVPVVELLSEGESETHRAVLRPDSDGTGTGPGSGGAGPGSGGAGSHGARSGGAGSGRPGDLYRLYQVAGTGHITGRHELSTNRRQMAGRGWAVNPSEVRERVSDGRMDLVARAVFAAVDRWIADGTVPPRMPGRFGYDDPAGPATRGIMPESLPLVRDADGNVAGGIRTPWVEVPLGGHFPHSTPVPGRCEPAPHAPYADPAMLANLWAHLAPFPAAELARRYGDRDGYLARLEAAAQTAVKEGWLLAEDLPELLAGAREEAADVW